jgi:hypothetical protein
MSGGNYRIKVIKGKVNRDLCDENVGCKLFESLWVTKAPIRYRHCILLR